MEEFKPICIIDTVTITKENVIRRQWFKFHH